MLGLSIDKLLIVAIVAAFIIGPQRLPGYAKRLGEIVRGLRSFLDAARARAETETGLTKEDWASLDPRQYDPRRIVREALAEPAASQAEVDDRSAGRRVDAETDAPADAPSVTVPPPGESAVSSEDVPSAPARRYIVTGSSAHPRRVLASASAAPAERTGDDGHDTPASTPVSGGARA